MELKKQILNFDERGLCLLDEGVRFDNFVDLLNYRCQQHPDRTAINFLVDGELGSSNQIGLNYRSLSRRVRALANHLQSHYKPQSRILILCPAGNDFVVAFLACLYARMIAVPCALPSRREKDWQRVFSITHDSQACAIITDDTHITDYQTKFHDNDCDVISSESTNTILEKNYLQTPVMPQDIAFLQYTSGSTGTPKGVIVTQANLMHNQQVIQTGLRNNSMTQFVSWLPLFHDMGLIGCLLQALYLGVPFNYMSPVAFLQRPMRWLEAISHFGATTSGGPNFAYDLCVNRVTDEHLKTLNLSSWTCASNGSEPIKAETLERFYRTFSQCGLKKVALSPCYGLAEGTLMVTGGPYVAEPAVRHLNSQQLEQGNVVDVSKDHPNCKKYVGSGVVIGEQVLRIVNPQTKQLCSEQEVGEIWVKGASIAQGYWQRPEQTINDFKAYTVDSKEGPFLRTGDAGFLDQNGELFISSRLKDMMILHGRNLYPQDIEHACEDSLTCLKSGASAAFSLLVQDEEKLVIVQEVERSELRRIDCVDTIKSIRRVIAKEFQISVYDVVLIKPGSLLKTTSGKVQRRNNKLAYMEGKLSQLASHRSS